MKAICDGTRTRGEVVRANIDQFRDVYVRTVHNIAVLKAVSIGFLKYMEVTHGPRLPQNTY